MSPLGEGEELLFREYPVRAVVRDSGLHLLQQAGHANLEEFVQVVGHNGEEFYAFQKGIEVVLGLLKHPPVKAEPGDFPICIKLRLAQVHD